MFSKEFLNSPSANANTFIVLHLIKTYIVSLQYLVLWVIQKIRENGNVFPLIFKWKKKPQTTKQQKGALKYAK